MDTGRLRHTQRALYRRPFPFINGCMCKRGQWNPFRGAFCNVSLYLFGTGSGGSTVGAERKHRRVSGFAVYFTTLNKLIYGLYTAAIQSVLERIVPRYLLVGQQNLHWSILYYAYLYYSTHPRQARQWFAWHATLKTRTRTLGISYKKMELRNLSYLRRIEGKIVLYPPQ